MISIPGIGIYLLRLGDKCLFLFIVPAHNAGTEEPVSLFYYSAKLLNIFHTDTPFVNGSQQGNASAPLQVQQIKELRCGKKKKATESFDSIALVPHIGVEPMIYCVRGSCPGPLDECGVLVSALPTTTLLCVVIGVICRQPRSYAWLLVQFLCRNRLQKYNYFLNCKDVDEKKVFRVCYFVEYDCPKKII